MTPRKKIYTTKSEAQKAFAERQQEAGKRRVCFWLSDEAIEKLARIAEAGGNENRSEVVEALIEKAKEPKRK